MKECKAGRWAWGVMRWEFHMEGSGGGSGKILLKLTHEHEGNEGVRQVWVRVLSRINRTYKGPTQEQYT